MLTVNARGNTAHGSAQQNNGIIVNYAAEKLRPGFFKTSNYEDFKNVNRQRVPETCRWFLNHGAFVEWKANKRDALLWLSGDPGSGKSVLSRALIDEGLASENPVMLCYFFFRDNGDGVLNDPTTALCALIHQLVWQRNDLFQKYAIPAFEKCEASLKKNFEELWNVFTSVATDETTGDVVCILDALDECRQNRDPHSEEIGRDRLIERLVEFYCHSDERERGSSVKFLVTSRPYIEIENKFWSVTKDNPSIRLIGEKESTTISDDIKTFIDAEIQNIQLSEDLRKTLKEQLNQTANWNYLWVSLILKEIDNKISNGKTVRKLLSIINTLPKSIDQAYERILRICDKEGTAERAKQILQFVVAARTPLTVHQLDVALAIDTDSVSWEEELEYLNRTESIRKICGLFVTVVNFHVYLIHQTAREFLLHTDVSSGPQAWKHSINLQEANNVLADKCIKCLLVNELQIKSAGGLSVDAERALQEFVNYAASYWISHIHETTSRTPESIARSTQLCEIGGHDSLWYRIFRYETDHHSALWWAARLDLVDETRSLLEKSLDSNKQYCDLEDAKLHAVRNYAYGEKLTQIFMDPRQKDIKITEALLVRAAQNRKEVLKLIIGQGGVEITEKVILTAAMNIKDGAEMVANLLDERGDEVKITDIVLYAAARNTGCGDRIMSLLFNRLEDQHKISVSILLIASNYAWGERVLEILLDRDCGEFEVPEGVVEGAASNEIWGDKILARFLRRKGLPIKITERLVLQAVKNRTKGVENMKLLLDERGAGFRIDEEILEAAIQCHGVNIAKLLLDRRGAEFKISERVLVAATFDDSCSAATMKLLLEERGNEVKITESVVVAAANNDSCGAPTMKLLLDRRGDDFRINEEILSAAAGNHDCGAAIMKLLLERRSNEVKISEPVVEAAIRNWGQGIELMTMLREERGHEIVITEDLLRIAEDNFETRDWMMSSGEEEAIYHLVLEMWNEGSCGFRSSQEDFS